MHQCQSVKLKEASGGSLSQEWPRTFMPPSVHPLDGPLPHWLWTWTSNLLQPTGQLKLWHNPSCCSGTNSQHKNQAALLEDSRPCSPAKQPALQAKLPCWPAATHQASLGKQAEGPSSQARLKVSTRRIRTQINGCCFMPLYFGVNCFREKVYCHRNAKTWL